MHNKTDIAQIFRGVGMEVCDDKHTNFQTIEASYPNKVTWEKSFIFFSIVFVFMMSCTFIGHAVRWICILLS